MPICEIDEYHHHSNDHLTFMEWGWGGGEGRVRGTSSVTYEKVSCLISVINTRTNGNSMTEIVLQLSLNIHSLILSIFQMIL